MPSGTSTDIVDRDGEVVLIDCRSEKGAMLVLANMREFGETITLDKLHADGAGANALGIAALRGFARRFCEDHGARVLIVRGAVRTTGASPGKRSVLTFDFR